VLLELSKVKQRYEAVLAVIRDGLKITEVAEKFGMAPGHPLCLALSLRG
jgi:hypothetical protein